jgi:hypothetical protein
MEMKRFLVLALIGLSSCVSGNSDYTQPSAVAGPNSKTIAKSKDQVWAELVPALSKNFFVVNTIDKSSGLINISYGGDPEKYVDCGRTHTYVKNAAGERTYDFRTASARQNYEMFLNNTLLRINRNVDLDGRMNIVVEEQERSRTLLTVNARYVISIKALVSDYAGHSDTATNTINFNTGGTGHGQTITCIPNGEFERQILGLVN